MKRIITKVKNSALALPRKKRVAAYARVSSGKDAMLHSLSAQISYYSNFIQHHGDWEYVGVYADKALTGTKDSRAEFQHLLSDCRNGEIDMVITKSISRFARNTVTMLETIRELRLLNIDVFFEKENIHSMSGDGELMLTILASFVQEESRSISENVTWGKRKRFSDGKVSLPYKHFLGYEKGEDGLPKIVESEAQTICLIYKLFMEGKTPSGIGVDAFTYCTNFTSVTIPASVTKIEDYAFHLCSKLGVVTIANSSTSIANNAFRTTKTNMVFLSDSETRPCIEIFENWCYY